MKKHPSHPRRRPATPLNLVKLEDRLTPVFLGGIRPAVGDVDGDGFADILTAAGPGGEPTAQVFSGQTGFAIQQFNTADVNDRGGANIGFGLSSATRLPTVVAAGGAAGLVSARTGAGSVTQSYAPFDLTLYRGATVASGDVTGDGIVDTVVGAGSGGGPRVIVFDGRNGQEVRSFFGFDPAFRGGVNVAAGDVNADGIADIAVGAGPGGGPHVKVFDGRTGAVLYSQYMYTSGFTGGVSVALGDFTGDGKADLITGAGPGGGSHVKVVDLTSGKIGPEFFAYDPAFLGGVNVAAGDLDADGKAEIVTGAGPGGGPHVKAFHSSDLGVLASFYAYDPTATFGGLSKRADGGPGTGVNFPPVLSVLPDLASKGGSTAGPVGFTVSDDATPVANLGFTITSSNPVAVPISSVVLSGTGATRTLTVTPPVSSPVGSVTLTVTAFDSAGLSASRSFVFTVLPATGVSPPGVPPGVPPVPPTVPLSPAGVPIRYDFDHSSGAVASTAGFAGVRSDGLYSAGLGYGWKSEVYGFERTSSAAPDAGLGIDGAWGGPPGVFEVNVPAGSTFAARAYLGDQYFGWQGISITPEGGSQVIVNLTKDVYTSVILAGRDANGDGIATVTFTSATGTWVANGLDLVPGGGPLPAAAY